MNGAGGDAFLTAVFEDVQSMWRQEFEAAGLEYTPARMTIFRDEVHTACGTAGAGVGPFYCPADHGVYLDTSFFDALSRAADQQDPAGEHARSVRLELQADCLAGVWKHTRYRRGQLSRAGLEDALRAAAVVGDDFQQRRTTGTISPEDWTHGSSRQRQHWLATGFEQGKPAACDTFGA
jgi:predicted metalloprotease